ncbi:hypothetical protein TNCV_3934281 [Trichonephila clavipes]|nr:hypothetical protein TNCV_3934281 [Trichonephila clavipes]
MVPPLLYWTICLKMLATNIGQIRHTTTPWSIGAELYLLLQQIASSSTGYNLLLFQIPLEQESQVHLTFPHNNVSHQVLSFKRLFQGNAPEVQTMSSRRSRDR